MGLQDGALEAAKLLIPPRDNHGPAFRRWQWAVGMSVFAIAVTFTAHVMLACGLVPSLYPGFASAGEIESTKKQLQAQVQAVKDDTAQIRLAIWDQQLFQLRLSQCKETNGALRAALLEKITEISARYRSLAGRDPQLVNCGDL